MSVKTTVTDLMNAAMSLETKVSELEAENRKLRGSANNSKKLTPRDVERIRGLYRDSPLTQRQLADMFDVNPATVSRLVRGIYWK